MHSLKQVIIISKDRILKGLPEVCCRDDACYYLSDDYATYSKIRKKFANDLTVHMLGRKFHEAIEEVTEKFLSFSHRINQKNQSYSFWGTHLASRSSGTIPLLKYLVYFHCAKTILDHAASRTVFICDSSALAKLIQKDAKKRGMICQSHSMPMEKLTQIGSFFHLAAKAGYFFLFSLLICLYSRSLKNRRIEKKSAGERFIFRSWVTAGSVDKDGNYRDRNFGVLPNYLLEQGKDVWIIPLYFNLDRSIFTQMKIMSQSDSQFLFPEQYLSLLDMLKMLRDGVQSLILDLKGCEFEGDNVSSLIREKHWSVCLQPLLLSFNSIKYLLEKLAKREIRIDQFLYPIENNPPEKPFILAIRQCYPWAKIIGFQHTVWFKEQLGVFLLHEELSYHPLPDEIICSGRRYVDIINKTGFPPDMLMPGPNLRYTAVNQNLKINPLKDTNSVMKTFIILNFETNHSMELLEKTGAALKQFNNIKVYIKAHPMTPVENIKDFLRNIDFPVYEWATGGVQEWVLKSDVVIMTGSSVSNMETMATGVPLIRVSLDNNFDFDCFWDEYPFAPFTSSVEEIHHYLEKAQRMNSDERKRLIEFGDEVVKNYFEPVTTENLKIFM